jgi:hypothetical protein
MIIQPGQRRSGNFLTEISKIAVRLVLEWPFVLFCLLAALTLVGCSPRDPQREKDKAVRQAVVGVWSHSTPKKSSAIVSYNSDGSYWVSNTIGFGPSARGFVLTGTWNVISNRLVTTNKNVDVWNWGTRQPPKFLSNVDEERILWVTEQELGLASEYEGLNIHQTNILHKGVASKPPQSSTALETAKKIQLSEVKFDGLSLAVVISMLQDQSVKRDPARKGVTISLGPDAKQFADTEIKLELKDVTLAEALERVADSVGLKVQATDTELLLVK